MTRASPGPDSAGAARCRPRIASLIEPPGLACLRPAAGRSDRGWVGGEPLQRLDRIVELEVLDALLLELGRGHGEARIGLVVMLEQLVVRLGLADQMAPKIGLANPRPVLVIGVAQLRDDDVRVDSAG